MGTLLAKGVAAVVACVVVLQGQAASTGVATGASGASQAALPASLPLRRDASGAGDGGGWAAPLLLLTLAGAGGAWAGWRRLVRRRVPADAVPSQRIVRTCSQALTPHASLHVVQWHGEELLLACTGQQVSVIGRRVRSTGSEGGS